MALPFRFGLVAPFAASGAEWKTLATRAEAAGYSSLLLPDTAGPVFSPFSALATAAAVTTTLRVGNWVLANDFRAPALVAREAATLDLLSEGRYELGIGAGRGDNDYASLGLSPVESGGERLARLSESLEILHGLFSANGPFTFSGRHYSVKNATLYPKPQRRVPILMAAAGPRALRLAGANADIVAFGSGSREHFLEQREQVKAGAGERFGAIELASFMFVVPDDTPEARAAASALVRRFGGVDVDSLIASQAPNVLAGSQAAMIEQLQERRAALGLSYIVLSAQSAVWFAPVVAKLAGT
jgi:probable F420-dependent oxidoreductase